MSSTWLFCYLVGISELAVANLSENGALQKSHMPTGQHTHDTLVHPAVGISLELRPPCAEEFFRVVFCRFRYLSQHDIFQLAPTHGWFIFSQDSLQVLR